MKIGKYDISKKNMIIIGGIILAFVIGIILLTKNDGKIFYNPDANIKIVKSEASQIEFEDYKTNEFSIKKPKGWKVDTLGDYIHYTIKVYDPNNPTYQFFLNMKTEGYNKSEDAKRWQQKYYPNDMFAKTSVIASKDTEGFYKIFNDLGTLNNSASFTFPTLTDFTVIENLGKGPLGGDMLRATFKDANGKDGEGIFTAYVYDVGPYYVSENIISGKQIDIQYLNVYDTIFITTPKDKFIDWEDTLNTICSSLEFTDTFINGFNKEQDAVMNNFQKIRAIGNEISDGIMDSWNKRSTSFDIMSQKQSDATLGYERVYDTIFITTPKDEFIDWEDTLNTICSSLSFTDTFINGFNNEQDAVMKNFQQIRAIGNEISDGIMDSWNKRNTSFDIMSQKQSDATLGYERVYDTKTNEIYKAYNGFNDEYDGERYKPVTDDMYLQKTSGYIEK